MGTFADQLHRWMGEWVELTVNQQLVLFLVRCSVKGMMLNQLKTISDWFQWAVHVEIWTLEILFLQPCKFWLLTSYFFSRRGVRLKCYSWCWYSERRKRHCRILQAREESKRWQCKLRITMPGSIILNLFLGLTCSEWNRAKALESFLSECVFHPEHFAEPKPSKSR